MQALKEMCLFFFAPAGNDERRVVYLLEVNIDTTPAGEMTGPRSRVVVQAEAD